MIYESQDKINDFQCLAKMTLNCKINNEFEIESKELRARDEQNTNIVKIISNMSLADIFTYNVLSRTHLVDCIISDKEKQDLLF